MQTPCLENAEVRGKGVIGKFLNEGHWQCRNLNQIRLTDLTVISLESVRLNRFSVIQFAANSLAGMLPVCAVPAHNAKLEAWIPWQEEEYFIRFTKTVRSLTDLNRRQPHLKDFKLHLKSMLLATVDSCVIIYRSSLGDGIPTVEAPLIDGMEPSCKERIKNIKL